MPPPTDPIKYAEYIKRQSESHKGKPSARLGKKHTESAILKMRQAKEGKYDGKNNPFYGRKHRIESLQKMRGRSFSDIHITNLSNSMAGKVPWNKGIPQSETTRNKLSESQKGEKGNRFGKHHTPEAKERIRNAQKGKVYSKETLEKISASRIGKCCRDLNPNWNKGISFEPYCFKFNERRKKAVRIFFRYFCICCGKHVTENIIKRYGQVEQSVHHVDHDKEQGCNGRPFNLVPLCIECHAKELHHQEEYKAYINKTLTSGFEWGIWSREQYEIEIMYPE
jgi:hypothetical protein